MAIIVLIALVVVVILALPIIIMRIMMWMVTYIVLFIGTPIFYPGTTMWQLIERIQVLEDPAVLI